MAFSRAILWVSSSQTGWRVFPKNRSSPILWLLSLLFTSSEKLRCFSGNPWSILFFSDSLWTSTVSLRNINCNSRNSFVLMLNHDICHYVYNWCAWPFKIDIWMINTIISDTFDKCLYWSFSVGHGKRIETVGAFHLGKKPEISVVAKVEFPIGNKLFHLVVNPGTRRCPTVDLELVQTTRNVNRTPHSVRKFQPGKRDHLFRFSTFSGNFPVERTDETCSIYCRTGNSGNFD